MTRYLLVYFAWQYVSFQLLPTLFNNYSRKSIGEANPRVYQYRIRLMQLLRYGYWQEYLSWPFLALWKTVIDLACYMQQTARRIERYVQEENLSEMENTASAGQSAFDTCRKRRSLIWLWFSVHCDSNEPVQVEQGTILTKIQYQKTFSSIVTPLAATAKSKPSFVSVIHSSAPQLLTAKLIVNSRCALVSECSSGKTYNW